MLGCKLLKRQDINIDLTVIEKNPYPGGIAASFKEENIWLDYGSHRLHPSTPEEILNDIKEVVGSSLHKRVRNGRIRLMGRFLKFPLKPLDCLLHLPPAFGLGVFVDLLKKPFKKKRPPETFGDCLLDGLGPTVCSNFYFPYARKLWGYPPDQIDIEQARKRVSAGSIFKILKKIAGFLPGIKTEDTGIFYYPEEGIGQISEKLAVEVKALGGHILYENQVHLVTIKNGAVVSVSIQQHGQEKKNMRTDFLFSTIPITHMVEILSAPKNHSVMEASHSLAYRNMVFFYLVMDCKQWQPVDAHYFPEENFIFSRISEGKNYNGASIPRHKTIICCEIPCQPDDEIWRADDNQLKHIVLEDMKKAGIPARQLVRVFTKRQANVYPIYTIGYPRQLEIIETYLSNIQGLITLGRQGLFTHDNIHHTMMMADSACKCFGPEGRWDEGRWTEFYKEFANYVVED